MYGACTLDDWEIGVHHPCGSKIPKLELVKRQGGKHPIPVVEMLEVFLHGAGGGRIFICSMDIQGRIWR